MIYSLSKLYIVSEPPQATTLHNQIREKAKKSGRAQDDRPPSIREGKRFQTWLALQDMLRSAPECNPSYPLLQIFKILPSTLIRFSKCRRKCLLSYYERQSPSATFLKEDKTTARCSQMQSEYNTWMEFHVRKLKANLHNSFSAETPQKI